jgi:hypothetical protein
MVAAVQVEVADLVGLVVHLEAAALPVAADLLEQVEVVEQAEVVEQVDQAVDLK